MNQTRFEPHIVFKSLSLFQPPFNDEVGVRHRFLGTGFSSFPIQSHDCTSCFRQILDALWHNINRKSNVKLLGLNSRVLQGSQVASTIYGLNEQQSSSLLSIYLYLNSPFNCFLSTPSLFFKRFFQLSLVMWKLIHYPTVCTSLGDIFSRASSGIGDD